MSTKTTLSPQPVFEDSKVGTNMPFFDGTTLLFCQSSGTVIENIPTTGAIWKRVRQNKALAERLKNLSRSQPVTWRPWKMAWCNWKSKAVHAISTGLPASIPERSPAFYWEGDTVHLSFISGGPTSAGFLYRLYTCSGPDLSHLDAPKPYPLANPPLFFGFVSPHHVCWGDRNIIQLSEKATGSTFQLMTGFHRVASVSFLSEDPAKLLITGLVDKQHTPHTVLYDLATGNVSDISIGEPVYKSSLHGSHLVFTQKQKGEFEQRELHHGKCTLSPSNIKISKEA